MYTDSTLRIIKDNEAFQHADTGVKYPSNYPKEEIEGLYKVTESTRPNDTSTTKVTGFHINENYSQVWDVEQRSQEEIDLLLQKTKTKKISQVKALRNSNLLRPTPHTVTYGGNIANKTFNVGANDLAMFNIIIDDLRDKSEGSTRGWTDANGDRLELTINDFKSLRSHLVLRDNLEYNQAQLKITAINNLSTIEEVEAFDINEVIV